MATAQTQIQKIETSFGVWFDTKHLIMLAIIGILLVFSTYEIESHRADVSDAKAAAAIASAQAANAAAATAVAQNNQVQAQATQQIQVLANENVSLQTQIDALKSSIVARDKQVSVQQQSDSAMSPDQLAQRWSTVVKLTDPISVSKTAPFSYTVTLGDALATVQQLETTSDLSADLADANSQINALTDQLGNETQAYNVEKSSHLADTQTSALSLAAKQKDLDAANAQLTAAKADARKGKLKTFFIGFVAGFVAGVFK